MLLAQVGYYICYYYMHVVSKQTGVTCTYLVYIAHR